MNKDQIKGRVEEDKGKVKEAAGVIGDDEVLAAEGNSQKMSARSSRALVISRKLLTASKSSTAESRHTRRQMNITLRYSQCLSFEKAFQ